MIQRKQNGRSCHTLIRVVEIVLLSCVLAGCSATGRVNSGTTINRANHREATDIRYPGAELDYVARTLERFGYMSIAGATFIEPDPRFQFNLDLTPRELFERNRIEGSSRQSSSRALDVQVSVQAEMVQNLISQMSATNDPSLLENLKQKLQSAAFSSLLDQLPPELTENIDLAGQTAPMAPPATGSDGGHSYLNLAHAAINQSFSHLAAAEKLYGDIDATATVTDPKESLDEAQGVLENAVSVAQSEAVAMREGGAASVAAQALLLEIESRLSGAPGGTLGGGLLNFADISTLKSTLRDGKSNADAIVAAVDSRQKDIREAYDSVKENLQGKAQKVLEAAKHGYIVPKPKTPDVAMAPKDVLDALSGAVDRSRALAASAGVEITTGKPATKTLVADRIKNEQRNAKAMVGDFSEGLDPYTGDVSPNIRQLLLNSASDHMTQEMLRWLSYPSGYGPGKRVYLTMATVSCVPGRDTYQNFMGHVSVEIAYAKEQAGGNVEKTNGSPLVFSLYPFLDTQFLDLRSSQRRALTMAFQLVLNGYPAAANAFLDYAKKDELDVHTVTGINSVVGSVNGSNVGFTFSPRLTALNDPSKLRGRPGMLLQPQSFPALIMIVCDEGDLVLNNPEKNDHVIWTQSSRWTAAPKPTVDRFGFPGRVGNQLWYLRPRLSEVQMGKMANDLDRAYDVLDDWRSRNEDGATTYETDLLKKRISHLRDYGLGADVFMGLPLINDIDCGVCPLPDDLAVEPKMAWIDASTTLYITSPSGQLLKGTYDVTVGGIRVNAVKIAPGVLRAVVPAFAETGNLALEGGAEVPVVVASHTGAKNVGVVKLAYLRKEASIQPDEMAECGQRIANGYITADGGDITVVVDGGDNSRIKARMSHRIVQGNKPVNQTTMTLKGGPKDATLEFGVMLRGKELYQDGPYTIKTAADKSLGFEPEGLKSLKDELTKGVVFAGPHHLNIVGADGAVCTDIQITGNVTIKAKGIK